MNAAKIAMCVTSCHRHRIRINIKLDRGSAMTAFTEYHATCQLTQDTVRSKHDAEESANK